MDVTELKSLARLKVRPAGKAGSSSAPVTDANLLIILNNGVKDIARRTKCLPTYGTFDTEADISEYTLSTELSDFLAPIKGGLYYYDSSDYDPVEYVTLEYMNENHSDWLTASSNAPERAFIIGDKLNLHPAPASTITDGILMYYAKKPTPMDTTTNLYPFGGTAEISWLSPYHTLIIDYWAWQAYEILDINEPNSPRIRKTHEKYLMNVADMKNDMVTVVNNVLATDKKRLKLRSSYFESKF